MKLIPHRQGQINLLLVLLQFGCFLQTVRAESLTPATIAAKLRAGGFQQALVDSDRLLTAHPSDPVVGTLKGLALRGLGRWKESLARFDRVLKSNPSFLPALEAASETAYQNKDARAYVYLQSFVKRQPVNTTAHAMLGALEYERCNCKSSAEHFRRSEQIVSTNDIAASQYSACLLRLNRANDAVGVLQRAVASNPGNKDLQYNLAVALLQNSQPKEAVATLEAMLSSFDPDADILNLLASAQAATGDLQSSVTSLRKAIQAAPTEEANYLDLAIISLEHDSPSAGFEVADTGIRNVPNPSYRLYSVRATAQAELSHYDEAEADFAKSLELQPDNAGAVAGKSLYYSLTDQPEKAVPLLRKRLGASPRDPVLNFLLADALVRAGASPAKPAFKEAQAALQRALSAKPKYVEALALAGKLYVKEGALSPASDVLELAIQNDPTNRAAMNQLLLVLRKLGRTEEAQQVATRLTQLIHRDREESNKVRVDESRETGPPVAN